MIKILSKAPISLANRLFFKTHFTYTSHTNANVAPLEISDSTILILAPHQDDEILGCGCLIQQLIQNNCHVKCVFITDGSSSVSDTYNTSLLAQIRKKEAQTVADFLGMETPDFLELPDGQAQPEDASCKRLGEIMNTLMPHYVFIPYFVDGHPDHCVTTGIYLKALQYIPKDFHPPTYAYEINAPILLQGVTHYVDCSGYIQTKEKALELYKSQTMSFESLMLLTRLNRYLVKGSFEGIEFFKQLDLPLYEKAYTHYTTDQDLWTHFSPMYSLYFMIPAYLKGLGLKKQILSYMKKGGL